MNYAVLPCEVSHGSAACILLENDVRTSSSTSCTFQLHRHRPQTMSTSRGRSNHMAIPPTLLALPLSSISPRKGHTLPVAELGAVSLCGCSKMPLAFSHEARKGWQAIYHVRFMASLFLRTHTHFRSFSPHASIDGMTTCLMR